MNLIESLQRESDRVRELLIQYDELGPAGRFGATMLRADLAESERAIASVDGVWMLAALKALQGCQ